MHSMKIFCLIATVHFVSLVSSAKDKSELNVRSIDAASAKSADDKPLKINLPGKLSVSTSQNH